MLCIKCKREIGDNDTFCPGCGTKQTPVYKEVFLRNGLSDDEFIDNINKWFQWHPKAANVKATFDMDTAVGLLVNKYKLNKLTIEYELFDTDNKNQYGIVKEEKFGFIKKSAKDYVAEWKTERPNVTVVNWSGGVHTRGSTASHLMNGLGGKNRMTVYILFKFPRNK